MSRLAAPYSSGVAAFLLILVSVISWAALRPLSPWLDVSLYVPGSFKPWVHNGTRLAVMTTWTSSEVALSMHVPRDYEKTFTINDLNKAAIVASALHSAPNVVILLEDIQKASFVFCRITSLSLWLTLAAALLLFGITLNRIFRADASSPRMVSATVSREGITFRRFHMSRPLVEKGRGLPYVLAGLSAILALCAALSYALTLQVDVKTLLPTIVRDLELLCISHGVHSCSIAYRLRSGCLMFVVANAVQIASALGIAVFWDRGRTKTRDWAEASMENEDVGKRVLMDEHRSR